MKVESISSRKATWSDGWNRRMLSMLVVLCALEITPGQTTAQVSSKSTSFNRICDGCAIKNQVPLSTTVARNVFHCGMICMNYAGCALFEWAQGGVCNAYAQPDSLEWQTDAKYRAYATPAGP